MYRSSLWKGCTCLNFPTWRGAQNPKTVDFWPKKWWIETLELLNPRLLRWITTEIDGIWFVFRFFFCLRISIADLSPIHFREQSHRWHQAGSKYWWNQGLALIHGPNLQPWIWRKYFFKPRHRMGWSHRRLTVDETRKQVLTRLESPGEKQNQGSYLTSTSTFKTILFKQTSHPRFCCVRFFQQRLPVFNHRQTSFEVWMWSMGSRWIGHKYPFRLDQVSIEMVFSGFRLQECPQKPIPLNTIFSRDSK